MVDIYCYLERQTYKVLKFHDVSNVSFLKKNLSFFEFRFPIAIP